jgi:HEAT repeat protein
MAAAEALGKISDERSIHALAELLEDVPWVALAAIESIGVIGGDDALTVLHSCLEKEEYMGMACTALEQAGNQESIEYLAPYVIEGDTKEFALKAIVTIAEREGVQLPPSYFAEMVALLVDLQQSNQDDIRRAAFIALSWSEDMRGLQYFLDALNDEKLQEYAVNGLISLGERAAPDIVNALVKPGTNRVVLAKVLSMSGDKGSLLAFADDEDAEVRVEAALAAGSLQTDDAFEVLLRLEKDPVEEVSAAARVSLKNYGRISDNL